MLKGGDLNRVYTDNPQEKEDFTEVTSKDQESESTKADSNPLISLLSPLLKAVCSKLLLKYPEIVRDTEKWTLSLRSFMLGRIGLVISQLKSKGKMNNLTLSFDELLSTLGDAKGIGFNVEWLKSRVIALRDLMKAWPSIRASLSLLHQLRPNRISCISKAKETRSAIEAHNTSITKLQESIVKLQKEFSSKQEANSALQTWLEGVLAE